MKRATVTGTIVLAAALTALPVSGLAQTAPPQQPPATQPPATQPPATQPPTTPPATAQPAQAAPAVSAEEHLAKANAALNEIQPTAVTGTAQAKLMALRKHMAALDRAAAAKAGSKAAANSWATDVAAIDRILTELTTPPAPAGDPTPPTGTTGATGTTGRTSRAQAAVSVDDATRAKLMEVRTHITAFAAAKSGTAAPAAPSAPPPDAPVPPTTPTPPATAPPATEPPATAQPPATAPPTTQPPATQPPATPPSEPAAAAPAGKVDKEAAKRHLTEARDTLSQLTQLPEAAQLTGDARTQVSQVIANFNELITTQTEWRAAFDKVQANLTALIGAERTDEANVPPPATGTAGAVGTSGMTALDQKVRDKLVEFRAKLAAFERAAGGGAPK